MRVLSLTAVALALAAGPASMSAQQPQANTPKFLEVGAVAPNFTLTASTREGVGKAASLTDFRGQPVIIAFFPRARTGG